MKFIFRKKSSAKMSSVNLITRFIVAAELHEPFVVVKSRLPKMSIIRRFISLLQTTMLQWVAPHSSVCIVHSKCGIGIPTRRLLRYNISE